MEKGIESLSKFIVSRCNTTELLESIKELLNKISLLIPMPVDFMLNVTVAS